MKAPHKANEWFTIEVIAVGPMITILVNGKATVEWTDPKNRHQEGSFAIQQHHVGSVVRVRKVEIRELKPDQKGPPAKKNPAAVDPDRKAAEYVLSVGGTIRINGDETDLKIADPDKALYPWADRGAVAKDREISAIADLPRESFRLTWADLNDRPANDAGIANFNGCKHLMYLGLRKTKVSDDCLANFKDCDNLRELNLFYTQVGATGLAHIKDCKNLAVLALEGTRVKDDGLALFKGSKSLTHISLQNTSVSDAGMAHLKGCENLASIDLNRTQVSNLGLSHLMDCKDLKMLAIVFTKVTKTGRDDIRKRFPKCKIHEV